MSLRTWRRVLLIGGFAGVLFAYVIGGGIGALLLMGGWFLGWSTGLVMRQELFGSPETTPEDHYHTFMKTWDEEQVKRNVARDFSAGYRNTRK